MRTVHKHVLGPGENRAETHKGARFVHVANQGEQIAVWVDVDPDALWATVVLHVVPTGGEVPTGSSYVGTALLAGGSIVAHVYDGGEQ